MKAPLLLLGILIACALGCPDLARASGGAVTGPAVAVAPLQSSSGSEARSGGVTGGARGAALATDEDEKERTPKPRRRRRGEPQEEDEEDDDGDWFSDCLSGCLWSSLFGGSDDEQEAISAEIAPVAAPAAPTEDPIGGRYRIDPLNPQATTTPAWNAPGADSTSGVILCQLSRGRVVEVLGTATAEDEAWYAVSCPDSAESRGWIRAAEAVRVTPPSPHLEPSEEASPAEMPDKPGAPEGKAPLVLPVPRPDPRWALSLALSPIAAIECGDQALEDYESGRIMVDAAARLYPIRYLQLGLGLGYGYHDGDPMFDYQTSTLIDEPSDSDIQMFTARLHVGTRIPVGTDDTYVSAGIGPALCWVKESAKIEWTELDGEGQEIASGRRTDSISAWRFGADLDVEVMAYLSESFSIGASFGVTWVSWDPARQESLTLDWLEEHSFWMSRIGLALGFTSF